MDKNDLSFKRPLYNKGLKAMVVGIDVSKLKLDVTVVLEKNKGKHKVFHNNQDGFAEIAKWLDQLGVKAAHVCLEATGRYGEAVSLFLHQQGHTVSIVNPLRIKAYWRSEGSRAKTDKVDSGVIARFCKAQSPIAWTPPSAEEQALKDLYRCRQSLIEDQTRLSNRMEAVHEEKASFKIWKALLEDLEKKIKDVDAQIKFLLENDEDLGNQVELLKTIPGISQKTAVAILSELPPIDTFKTAREAAAFAGLTPSVRQSGTSVRGRGGLSKAGNAQIRKALYLPAIVAKKHNPLVEEFCKRLTAKGKAKMVVIGAAMRKLLHIVFGVLKHQKCFAFIQQEA
jgi:transposase